MSDQAVSPELHAVKERIEAAYADRTRFADPSYAAATDAAIEQVIAALDQGRLRVAEPTGRAGEWRVNAWVKQAILLYFSRRPLQPIECGGLEFYDKIQPKRDLAKAGVRVVPPGVARYGSYLEPGAVLMPGYVNIGAHVGSGTMIDTWATVGSCAQIGRNVHLAGGVGIGGVLEPPGAVPVVIEDGCFLGSRAIVVEGVHVEREAVLGANVVLTASTAIVDVTGSTPVTLKGRVPARAVLIPGTRPKQFPAGEFQVACALLVGYRKQSTELRTSLNDALREFDVQV